MWLLEGLAELTSPTRCAGCEYPGALLCSSCDSALARIDAIKACPECGAPYGALVCTECWSTEYAFSAALCLGELEGALARAVVLHKDAGERRLGALLGSMLAEVIACHWDGWADAVCWIPPTRAALSRRGFDHGYGLARRCGPRLGVQTRDLLVRERARDQRLLGRSGRRSAAHGSFHPRCDPPAHVLVVDDVLTTGSTFDAAATALLAAGAQEVRVAAVARAW